MNNSIHFSKTQIEFGSLLSYSPHGDSNPEKQSKTIMKILKSDEYYPVHSGKHILMSELISDTIMKKMALLPFSNFFKTDPILVPVPNSSFMKSETLWVPQRIAKSLVQNGLGKEVIECLKRVKPLPKAATSSPERRPKAAQHLDSLEVLKILSEHEEILLIDDIVTRGTTLFAAVNKLAKDFPKAHILAFAAMRTISPPFVFKAIYDPCIGTITINGNDTFRRP